jgi:hypothetical protein
MRPLRTRDLITGRLRRNWLLIVWGGLVTCGGLVIRLVLDAEFTYGPIANRPQVINCYQPAPQNWYVIG